MAITDAHKNRKIRKEALRDQLAAQGHVQHVVEILRNVQEPDFDTVNLPKLKFVVDTKLALIKKYLPDIKMIELSSDPDNPLLLNLSNDELDRKIQQLGHEAAKSGEI